MNDAKTTNREVRLFCKSLALFLAPFFFVLAFPLFVFWIAKEFVTPSEVVRAQLQDRRPALYGPAYTDCNTYYKLLSVTVRRPEVITLGSSRVMQFRSGLFTSPDSFFNAAGAVSKTRQFSYFLDNISAGREPAVIIVGLDQFTFSRDWDSRVYNEPKEQYGACEKPLHGFLTHWKTLYHDFFQHKFALKDVLRRDRRTGANIGLNALVNNNGFRNDGSYSYGKIIAERLNSKAPAFTDDFAKIRDQDKLYTVGGGVNAAAVAAVEDFLKESRARDIHVIGFLPPYAPSVYERLKMSSNDYPYVFKLETVLKPFFDTYGFRLYNFSNPSLIGASDAEMIDGIHGSEKTYLRLFIEMAQTDGVLGAYTDIEYLKKKLKMAHSLEVF